MSAISTVRCHEPQEDKVHTGQLSWETVARVLENRDTAYQGLDQAQPEASAQTTNFPS